MPASVEGHLKYKNALAGHESMLTSEEPQIKYSSAGTVEKDDNSDFGSDTYLR